MSTHIKAVIGDSQLPEENEGFPEIKVSEPLSLVIFGATGDLTRRKLLPGLYVMFRDRMLPKEFKIVAFARRDYTDETFRNEMGEEIRKYSRVETDDKSLNAFLKLIVYHRGNLDDAESYGALAERFSETEVYPQNRVYYLSTAPEYFGVTIGHLKEAGLVWDVFDKNWSRVVIEKPFGHDLESANALNVEVLQLLDESQVYRIDHYLGKETVQNILSFRFANAIFEPLFNNKYVDHIQVTAGETVGMESGRGAYYDTAGALRDMFQNHLLQLLCLVTMEPPSGMNAEAIHNEKVKALQSIVPIKPVDLKDRVVRAQYADGKVNGEEVPGYTNEDRVPEDSKTETYLAAKFHMNNWRWAGVPILLRTGKRMPKKMTEISVQFKKPPLEWFKTVECEGDVCDLTHTKPNVLTFTIAPDESISLNFAAKRPSMQVVVENATMEFTYSDHWTKALPEAYERLLLDVMRGDSTLFTRSDEVEAAWRVVDPIIKAKNDTSWPIDTYAPASWGPKRADELFDHKGQSWINE